MLSLSLFKFKGHSQEEFHLKNIQEDMNVSSDLDRPIQNCCFRGGRIGKSRYLINN